MNSILTEEFIFHKDIHSVISKNIKKYRMEKGLTQLQLSELVELSHDFIRRIESPKGDNNLSLETLYKISVVLDVPMDNFLAEDE